MAKTTTTATTRTASRAVAQSPNGTVSRNGRLSPEPHLGQHAPEIQRYGTLRQMPIALSAEARGEIRNAERAIRRGNAQRLPFEHAPHERYFGLWRPDGTPKPAVSAFSAFTAAAVKPPPMTPWIDISPDVYYDSPAESLHHLYARYLAYAGASAA